ncbi:MAG: hypothetical protein ACNS62_22040 [Candidatus Cyclobacteriaceae bacterium M3_2C_046]
MRFLFIGLISMLIITDLSAQTEDTETLMDQITSISGFGGFMMEFAPIDGDLNVATGGGGALLFEKKIFVGGYGLGLIGDVVKDFEVVQDARLRYNHGGFWLGYITRPAKLVHFGFDTKLGWGAVRLEKQGREELYDKIFVLSPQLGAEVNLTTWFKVNIAVGYRLVSGLENQFFTNTDFSNPTFSLDFLFGWFR